VVEELSGAINQLLGEFLGAAILVNSKRVVMEGQKR
jgi:hypothetical protein